MESAEFSAKQNGFGYVDYPPQNDRAFLKIYRVAILMKLKEKI